MNKIRVRTKREYDIIIDKGFERLPSEISALFSKERSLFVITDKNVGGLYGERLLEILSTEYEKIFTLAVDAGENSKNISTLSSIFDFLLANGADRRSVVIALGGGVIGDLAGLAAALYMRGISYVQIPTTLLAQVDSSIGGKTAVDFGGYKNIIGAFYQPSFVYINIETLHTLPAREFSGGMAEVIKYGLIADREFYEYLLHNIDNIHDYNVLSHVVARCVELKASVVEEDENDYGIRELLNFGHTVGHAVEALRQFELTHGECVALGTLAAMEISRGRGTISNYDIDEYKGLLNVLNMQAEISGLSAENIYDAMKKDKKIKSGKLTFVLLKEIGCAYSCCDVEHSEIIKAVEIIMKEV